MAARRTSQRAVSVSGQKDRRVQKTRASLREALHGLITEKAYQDIAVKDILDRANVGRSTFYMHFQDKDELLVQSIEDIVHSARATDAPRSGTLSDRLLWFSLPIFEYHEKHRTEHALTLPRNARVDLHRHLGKAVTDLISDTAGSSDLVVQFVVSTFATVFEWWIDQQRPLPASEVSDLFHALVRSGIAAPITARDRFA